MKEQRMNPNTCQHGSDGLPPGNNDNYYYVSFIVSLAAIN